MDSPNQMNTFNNFGPDENPERVEYYQNKSMKDKEVIRE